MTRDLLSRFTIVSKGRFSALPLVYRTLGYLEPGLAFGEEVEKPRMDLLYRKHTNKQAEENQMKYPCFFQP